MYYHRWPQRSSGYIKYYDRKQSVYREFDFDECPDFDWDNMLAYYPYASGTEAQRHAVANLSVVPDMPVRWLTQGVKVRPS